MNAMNAMKNAFASLFRSVVKCVVRIFPPNPGRASQSRDCKGAVVLNPSRDSHGAVSQQAVSMQAITMPPQAPNPPTLTPEQFRQMLTEALADPILARRVLWPLSGTVFPIQGGVPGTFLTVQDNGKVGIGTTDPSERLAIESNTETNLLLKTTGQGSTRVKLQPVGTGLAALEGLAGTMLLGSVGDLILATGTGGPLEGYNERMRVLATGNVGIGTTAPQQKLTLVQGSKFAVQTSIPTGLSAVLADGGSLTVGTTYYYVVTALDAAGETLQSSEVSATPTSPPDKRTINLSWTAVVGAASYKVYRRQTGSSGYVSPSLAGNPTTNSFTDAGVTLTAGVPPSTPTAGTPSSLGSSLILGTTATQQITGGPELITAMDTSQDHVVLWAGTPGSSPNNAMFLFSISGFLEWGAGGANDQDISLGRNAAGNLTIQSFNSTTSSQTFRVNTPGGTEVLAVDTQSASTSVRALKLWVNGAGGGATFDVMGTAGTTASRVVHTSTTEIAFGIAVQNENQLRFLARADGALEWGDGSNPTDTKVFRKAGLASGWGSLGLMAHTGFAGSESIRATAAVKTTDSSLTTLATITLGDNRAYYITVRVIARKSDGSDFAFFYKVALVFRQGGGATILTATTNNPADLGGTPIWSSGATGWACTLTNSGNDILVRVQTGASITVYWVATIEYQSVSTDA